MLSNIFKDYLPEINAYLPEAKYIRRDIQASLLQEIQNRRLVAV